MLPGAHAAGLAGPGGTRDKLPPAGFQQVAAIWLVCMGRTKAGFFNAKNISIPLPSASSLASSIEPRGAGQSAYRHNLLHDTKLGQGGHFAAWEQPDLFPRRSARAWDHCANHAPAGMPAPTPAPRKVTALAQAAGGDVMVANYEYLVCWRFHQAGSIGCAVRATASRPVGLSY